MGRAAKFTRIGLYSLLTMLGLVLLLWLAGWLLLPGLIQKELTRYGEKIGYRVTADAVSIAPFQLKASIEGLHIAPLAETKAAEAAQAKPEPERSKTTERQRAGRAGKQTKATQKKAAKEKTALAVEAAPASANHDDSLLKLGKISTQVRFWPLLSGQVSVMDVVLDSPTIVLSRGEGAKAEWNWARFVNALSKLSGPEPEKPEQPEKPSTLKISVDAVRINNARLIVQNGRWHDEFGPLTLVVDGYRNQGDDGKVGGMALSYALNLGKLSVPVGQAENGRARELLLNEVRLKGGVHRRVDQMFRIDVDLTVDEGTIASQWEIDPAKAAIKATLKIDKVPLAPFIAVVPANQPLQAKSGNLNGDLTFSLIERATHLAGQLAVNDLAIYAGESKDILLGWEKTQVNGLDYTQPPSDAKTPATLRLGEITLTRLQSRFELDKQHVSNFGHLFGAANAGKDAQTGKADTSASSVKEVKDSKDAAPGLRYDIRAIRLSQGRLYFADHSIQPDFMVNINTLNGFVLGISNAPGRVGSLALDGRVGPFGSLRGRGQLALTDPKMNNNVTLSFKNIPLNSTNPYAMTFAGYKIDSGSMDADLGYVTKAGQLQGSNRFVIRKIKIGDEVPGYQGTRLPLKLAVALLEDSDGMIELNIPVQGNVNDPQFGVGALVWQAFKTILTNAITAPFRLIGNLLGIEHGDVIDFVPGESSLLPAEQEKLQKIAGVLAKRPKAKLVLHGTYDASADTAALARATTDRAILAAAGIKVGVGEPLPEPNLTDPAVQSAVKSVYGSQIGRIKLAQRLLTSPDTVARYQQLRDELIQNVSINEAQLKQLAASRAQLAQSLVLGANKDPAFAARVVIGDTTTVSADDKGVALKVDIERID